MSIFQTIIKLLTLRISREEILEFNKSHFIVGLIGTWVFGQGIPTLVMNWNPTTKEGKKIGTICDQTIGLEIAHRRRNETFFMMLSYKEMN